jgi:hypothetical protein
MALHPDGNFLYFPPPPSIFSCRYVRPDDVSNRLSIGGACFLVHEDDSRSPVRPSFMETTSPLPEPHAIYDASNIRNVVVSNQLIAVLSVTLPSSIHALAVKLV